MTGGKIRPRASGEGCGASDKEGKHPLPPDEIFKVRDHSSHVFLASQDRNPYLIACIREY